MMQQANEQTVLRRYLLGQASEEDRLRMEQRLLMDSEYLNQLEMEEESLIDDYASGKMEKVERKEFEAHFLNSPERRDNVAFAKALRHYLTGHTTDEKAVRPTFRWLAALNVALACAIVVLAITSALLVRQAAGLRQKITSAEAERTEAERLKQEALRHDEEQRDRIATLEQELAEAKIPHTDSNTKSLLLEAGLSRGGDTAPIARLFSTIRWVRLEPPVTKQTYRGYRAQVQSIDGNTIWSSSKVKGAHGRFRVIVPTSLLHSGDYLLSLSGVTTTGTAEKIGTYFFRVVQTVGGSYR